MDLPSLKAIRLVRTHGNLEAYEVQKLVIYVLGLIADKKEMNIKGGKANTREMGKSIGEAKSKNDRRQRRALPFYASFLRFFHLVGGREWEGTERERMEKGNCLWDGLDGKSTLDFGKRNSKLIFSPPHIMNEYEKIWNKFDYRKSSPISRRIRHSCFGRRIFRKKDMFLERNFRKKDKI